MDKDIEKASKLLTLADPANGAGEGESHAAWLALHRLCRAKGWSFRQVIERVWNPQRAKVEILSFDMTLPEKVKTDGRWRWHGAVVVQVFGVVVPTEREASSRYERLELDKMGVNGASVTGGSAAKAIQKVLAGRYRNGLATVSQCCWLSKMGYDLEFRELTFDEAGEYFEEAKR